MKDRARLRTTFDAAADLYHRARPRYPEALFDAVDAFAGVSPPADVLEVGPATGTATIPLGERGHRVTGIELGPDLAEHARTNTAEWPNVTIIHASFDNWEPTQWGAFDLVVAATAWHWLDAESKCERAHRHLRPGGTLGFWSALHVVPNGGDTFFTDIQERPRDAAGVHTHGHGRRPPR